MTPAGRGETLAAGTPAAAAGMARVGRGMHAVAGVAGAARNEGR
jgi:hypothetical protein